MSCGTSASDKGSRKPVALRLCRKQCKVACRETRIRFVEVDDFRSSLPNHIASLKKYVNHNTSQSAGICRRETDAGLNVKMSTKVVRDARVSLEAICKK